MKYKIDMDGLGNVKINDEVINEKIFNEEMVDYGVRTQKYTCFRCGVEDGKN